MDKFTAEKGRMYRMYRVTAELLCLGDRVRGSIFRPSLEVLPATTLEGALRSKFPRPDRCVHPIGRILRARKEALVYSPRDRVAGVSKVPIQTELLTDLEAEVYVRLNDWTLKFPERFGMRVGAMRAQGCGWTEWEVVEDEVLAGQPVPGRLYSRVPDSDKWKEAFGIKNVIAARVGYLPIPERGARTFYQRALFEGSAVVADPVVVITERVASAPFEPAPREDLLAPLLAPLLAAMPPPPTDLKGSTLDTAGRVLALYGYSVARLHLKDKEALRAKDGETVQAAVAALDVLETHEPTRSNPELGAFILRKLEALRAWKNLLAEGANKAVRMDPAADDYRSILEQARSEIGQETERLGADIKRKFAVEIGNAVARYGVEGARKKLDDTVQRWEQRKREGHPAKGQSPENIDLAKRSLEVIASQQLLRQSPNVARLLLRQTLTGDKKESRNNRPMGRRRPQR